MVKRMGQRAITATLLMVSLALSAPLAAADSDMRVLVVRERATASLSEGKLVFKLLKIRGYSIDIRIDGEKRRLKLGEAIAPARADCTVIFEEISPETRIARFRTDCP